MKASDTIGRAVCRDSKDRENSLEDMLYLFLITSFDSDEVIIISPWLSSFRLSRRIVYYPYISSDAIDDVLKSLVDSGTKVYIAARCFDFIDYELLVLANGVINGSLPPRHGMIGYVRQSIEELRDRTNALLRFSQIPGIEFRFDVDQRLHSKVYVNDFMVLIGSANLTYSGIYRNLECLYMIPKEEKSYPELRNYAKTLLDEIATYDSCEKSVLGFTNSFLNLKLSSLRELVVFLDKIVRKISILES
ncbi:MAG: phospholipase D-like domain-containing protein [Thermosphaera sp.]